MKVDLYFSFRSPYSYLILPRIVLLRDKYGVDINFKQVYPLAIREPEFFKGKNLFTYFLLKRFDYFLQAKKLGMVFKKPRYVLPQIIEDVVKISEECNINTETPAWAIDRLSILELKIFHMDVEANRSSADEKHRLSCISKLEILKAQRKNLSKAIDQLLDNISNGKTMALTYKQMKMYNDDKLNPELYKD